jgi:hypothetical protein
MLSLEAQGKENADLVNAISGLCNGVQSGSICGTLSGGACMLAMYDRQIATYSMIPALIAWFKQSYEPLYDGIDCENIVGGNPVNRIIRCTDILLETFLQAKEILEEHGYDLDAVRDESQCCHHQHNP